MLNIAPVYQHHVLILTLEISISERVKKKANMAGEEGGLTSFLLPKTLHAFAAVARHLCNAFSLLPVLTTDLFTGLWEENSMLTVLVARLEIIGKEKWTYSTGFCANSLACRKLCGLGFNFLVQSTAVLQSQQNVGCWRSVRIWFQRLWTAGHWPQAGCVRSDAVHPTINDIFNRHSSKDCCRRKSHTRALQVRRLFLCRQEWRWTMLLCRRRQRQHGKRQFVPFC